MTFSVTAVYMTFSVTAVYMTFSVTAVYMTFRYPLSVQNCFLNTYPANAENTVSS